MTTDETKQPETLETPPVVSRPVLLTAFCLFAFIFYGFLSLLFLITLLFSGKTLEMVMKYTPEQSQQKSFVLFIIIAGFLLHALAFFGVIQIWRLRKTGYIIFGISALLIATCQLFLHHIPIGMLALNIALLILLGVYFKKYR